MTNEPQVFHSTFGRSVKNGATDTCSKCAHTIPEDHVPLILWDEIDKNIMWVLCGNCEGAVLGIVEIK